MRRLSMFLMVALLFFAATSASAARHDVGTPIPFAQLPAKALRFYKDHFSQADVASVILFSKYFAKKEYTVYMKDGSKVEFTSTGDWEKVKMKTNPVPDKIIPAPIAEYIKTNFPDSSVKEIKKSQRKIEVELTNGLEVEFNHQGQFLRIDD